MNLGREVILVEFPEYHLRLIIYVECLYLWNVLRNAIYKLKQILKLSYPFEGGPAISNIFI